MSQKPRKHHFVPQFWIRRFVVPDGKLWCYDHSKGEIRASSPKQVMQIANLYTIQPSRVDDVSLETVDLNRVDSEGSAVFDRVLNGDCSQSAKEELASFFAAQVLRDPDVVSQYNPRAQELALSLLGAFDATDFVGFKQYWEQRFPGTSITEREYLHIRSMQIPDIENHLEAIISALDCSEGLPELPFTDLVRSTESRRIIRDQLLALDWTLKIDVAERFVLGDAGALYQSGALNSLSAALSRGVALLLNASSVPNTKISSMKALVYEVDNLNLESAARSRRWLVGQRQELERLKGQVGKSYPPN